MLRLLFCTAAILPIGLLPWISSDAETFDALIAQESYAELVTDPNLAALDDCEAGDLPVFFNEGLVTSHSAEFISQGFLIAEDCGTLDVTIVPLLPKDPAVGAEDVALEYADELSKLVSAAANITNAKIKLDIADQVREEEISTLYMNGRAAILHIEPEDAG